MGCLDIKTDLAKCKVGRKDFFWKEGAAKVQVKDIILLSWHEIIFANEILNYKDMTFSELKNIVGLSSQVKVKSSSLRYSELYALANKAKAMESGRLEIVVESGTLSYSEIQSLVSAGGDFVAIDLTQL